MFSFHDNKIMIYEYLSHAVPLLAAWGEGVVFHSLL